MALIPRETIGLPARTGIALQTRKPAGVTEFIVHYGDGKTPKTEAEEVAILKQYDAYHRSKDWGAIGYSLAVGPVTGKVYEARGLDRVGAHTKGHNTTGVGVVLIGGEGNLTGNAKTGLQEAYRIACAYAGRDLAVYGHKDFANTDCPGKATYAWLQTGEIKQGGSNTMGQTTKIDGRTVPVGTAGAFQKLAAAFKQATGYTLHVRDGLRTYAEQADLYKRWKAGTFSSPSVAPPGTSLHESGRALDVYDSGSTPGVTVAGNIRSNWLRANATKFGFNPAGYGFREPWHIEYTGAPWKATTVKPTPAQLTVDGYFGAASTKRLQQVLGTPVDGVISGQPVTSKKNHARLTSIVYGKGGSAMVLALQKKLGVAADGLLGPSTIKAWQKKLGVAADGIFGGKSATAAQKALKAGKAW